MHIAMSSGLVHGRAFLASDGGWNLTRRRARVGLKRFWIRTK